MARLARDAQVSDRAERLAVEKALVAMGDFVWCPAGCASGGFTTGSGVGVGRCRSVTCQDCGFAFCATPTDAAAWVEDIARPVFAVAM